MDLSTDTPEKIVLAKGTQVTCPNGHPVCEVVEDIYFGTTGWGRCFGNFKQREPKLGQSLPVYCEHCDQPWMVQTVREYGRDQLGAGMALLIASTPIHVFVPIAGWDPPLPADAPPLPTKPQG